MEQGYYTDLKIGTLTNRYSARVTNGSINDSGSVRYIELNRMDATVLHSSKCVSSLFTPLCIKYGTPYISPMGKITLFTPVLNQNINLRKSQGRHRRESVVHVF